MFLSYEMIFTAQKDRFECIMMLMKLCLDLLNTDTVSATKPCSVRESASCHLNLIDICMFNYVNIFNVVLPAMR